MDKEVWQALLALENRDIVSQWFDKIHHRQLNERRSLEIMMAAKQSREYFRNASVADYSVRPLLTFYGVASLSRSVSLLFMKTTGEPALTAGHGIETIGWPAALSGDISASLKQIKDLKIKVSSGLFSDFIQHTRNRMPVHIHGEAVDWRIDFHIPETGTELTLGDILDRLPDLSREQRVVGDEILYAAVNEIKSIDPHTLQVKALSEHASRLGPLFEKAGYSVSVADGLIVFTIPEIVLARIPPQFTHAYLDKMFNKIPRLYVVVPIETGGRYSQLGFTYMLGFMLGMLVRYFPTHWGSLIGGAKGDRFWPTINRAQRVVEETFPELIYELIMDVLSHPFDPT